MPPADDTDISTLTVDKNGIQHLVNDDIRDLRFVEVNQQRFFHPDSTFTGFAANGSWYTDGQADPGHVPFKASWATEEGPNLYRGELSRFPDRLFIITTAAEVVMLDADSLEVWMRFILIGLGHGSLLGNTSAELRGADFANGFLFVATDDGLRIADFVQDRGMRYGSSTSACSSTGLSNRNTNTYTEATPVPGATHRVVSDDCLCVDSVVKLLDTGSLQTNLVVSAVGHDSGITGVLCDPNETYPVVLKHLFRITYGVAWYAFDDNDGDSYTPYLKDDVSNWDGDGVRVGDTLVTDVPSTHTITRVESDKLSLDPELNVTDSGSLYYVLRKVEALLVNDEGYLFFANGVKELTYVDSEGWYDGATFNGFDRPYHTVDLSDSVGSIFDILQNGEDVFAATDVGVFKTTLSEMEDGRTAPLTYSISGGGAAYEILEGSDPECWAMTVDPESGNLLVACVGTYSTLSEISQSLQQTYRFFEREGEVKALIGFRNASGPPTVEVS